jgi:serine/threonine-protein kinase
MSGRYRLHTPLAHGDNAETWLANAQDPGLPRELVVKKLLPHLSGDPQFALTFLADARLVGLLDHPNLLKIHDVVEEDGACLIALEHAQGRPLGALARKAREGGEPLPCPVVAALWSGASEGLHHAHDLCEQSGAPLWMVERDIGLDHLMVTPDGEAKLDLGVPRVARVSPLPLAYAAPELRPGQGNRRADVYAIGAMLYELLAGRRPAPAGEPLRRLSELREDLPPSLGFIVERAMAKDPEARHPHAGALAAELRSYLAASNFAGASGVTAAVERLGQGMPAPTPGAAPPSRPAEISTGANGAVSSSAYGAVAPADDDPLPGAGAMGLDGKIAADPAWTASPPSAPVKSAPLEVGGWDGVGARFTHADYLQNQQSFQPAPKEPQSTRSDLEVEAAYQSEMKKLRLGWLRKRAAPVVAVVVFVVGGALVAKWGLSRLRRSAAEAKPSVEQVPVITQADLAILDEDAAKEPAPRVTEEVAEPVAEPAAKPPAPVPAAPMLWIDSVPDDAEVFAGGRVIGTTPLARDLTLPRGTRLEIRKPGYQSHRHLIRSADKDVRIKVTLKRKRRR